VEIVYPLVGIDPDARNVLIGIKKVDPDPAFRARHP